MNDSELWRRMRDANIPRWAVKTTLPLLGQEKLRERLKKKSFREEKGYERHHCGLQLIARRSEDMGYTRRVFYVCAKELVLQGYSVECYYLSRLVTKVKKDMQRDIDGLRHLDFLFIDGFYDCDMPMPFSGYESHVVSSSFLSLSDAGVGLCTLSSPIVRSSGNVWWPSRLLNSLGESTTSLILEKP